ncbi:MAG: hypothetical protein M1820_008663 [Bogoriella megaspora]|nr:MAG: hypothetical protein M1820_008663 [Bogoriella megaspora]
MSPKTLERLTNLQERLVQQPYSLLLHLLLSHELKNTGYPDLAAGHAYKALLLADEALDESADHHEQAFETAKENLTSNGDDLSTLSLQRCRTDCHILALDEHACSIIEGRWREAAYRLLSQSLLDCGCLRSAIEICTRGLQTLSKVWGVDTADLEAIASRIRERVRWHFHLDGDDLPATSEWPEQGAVRREVYPWNDREPDRFSDASLHFLNAEMQKVAPKLEVRVTELPLLVINPGLEETQSSGNPGTVKQLGVFAAEDLKPGSIVLNEISLLTSNNRLNDTLCDACSSDLPDLKSSTSSTAPCSECNVAIFCSQKCHDLAQDTYHPALCDRDIESIAKDVPPSEAADSLYSLLLLRALAMAETQDIHPLDLKEVKYIWGDFNPTPTSPSVFSTGTPSTTDPSPSYPSPFHSQPRTLPFTFSANILLPLHMLEKMDIDIFARAPRYDFWVFNTLYAKFRGTASARLTGRGGGRARGPEVGAVHPLWCLANHSCDPNVSWEWGGSIRFTVREERVQWRRERDGVVEEAGKKEVGVRKGEEVLGHYCDVGLQVEDRRVSLFFEWKATTFADEMRRNGLLGRWVDIVCVRGAGGRHMKNERDYETCVRLFCKLAKIQKTTFMDCFF